MNIVHKIQEIKKIAESLETNQGYLELGILNELLYPLQKLNYEEWNDLSNQIEKWDDLKRMILVDGIIEIKDNKISNFDTSKIIAQTFILSKHRDAEVLIQHLKSLDNGIPKEIDLINDVFEKTKWLETQCNNYEINFDEKFKIINKLYNNAIC